MHSPACLRHRCSHSRHIDCPRPYVCRCPTHGLVGRRASLSRRVPCRRRLRMQLRMQLRIDGGREAPLSKRVDEDGLRATGRDDAWSVGLNVHPSAILSSSALRIDLTYLSPVLDSRPNESMNHSLGGTVRTSPADRSGSMCKPFSCLRSRSPSVPFFTRYSTRAMRPLSLAWTLAPIARDFLGQGEGGRGGAQHAKMSAGKGRDNC